MAGLKDFIFSSDYDSLKNDARGEGQLVVPASTSIAVNNRFETTLNLSIGSPESLLSVKVRNNRSGPYTLLPLSSASMAGANIWHESGVMMGYIRQAPGGATYTIFVSAIHAGGDTVRLSLVVPNVGTGSVATRPSDDVFDFIVRCYKSPFTT